MNNKVKRIADKNFRAKADLKVQYIFDSGYCFFNKARADEHARATREKYHTVKRDAKQEQKEADNEVKAEKLQAELDAKMQALLDESDKDKKAGLEAEIDKLEKELEEVQK